MVVDETDMSMALIRECLERVFKQLDLMSTYELEVNFQILSRNSNKSSNFKKVLLNASKFSRGELISWLLVNIIQ